MLDINSQVSLFQMEDSVTMFQSWTPTQSQCLPSQVIICSFIKRAAKNINCWWVLKFTFIILKETFLLVLKHFFFIRRSWYLSRGWRWFLGQHIQHNCLCFSNKLCQDGFSSSSPRQWDTVEDYSARLQRCLEISSNKILNINFSSSWSEHV